ncbi:MAG: antibiotic biosynthesis monooxygenase [Chloroflexi bacterium]|nr:antibiotic biosynthesis monooxygenase [Chloroflexota bacterium]MDA1147736.1 antibiotic biosynthesis monooxygenase [Chloroflexota bacterium]
MYGTVARLRVQDGKQGEFEAELKRFEARNVPGFVRTLLYRMDANASELMMVFAFTDKAAYTANANSPEQGTSYAALRATLAADPEWNDGEIVMESIA